MLFGKTGSGKSLLNNWLQGFEFKRENGKLQMIPQPGKESATIGQSDFYSLTVFPQVFRLDSLWVVDCPGLHDTRGPIIKLAIKLILASLFATANSVKLVWVSNYNELVRSRSEGMWEMAQQIKSLLTHDEVFKLNACNIFVVITQLELKRLNPKRVATIEKR